MVAMVNRRVRGARESAFHTLRQPPRDGVQHVWQQIITSRDQSYLHVEGCVTDATMWVMGEAALGR
jgi:hypothetical protein